MALLLAAVVALTATTDRVLADNPPPQNPPVGSPPPTVPVESPAPTAPEEVIPEEIRTQVVGIRDPDDLDPSDPIYPIMVRVKELREEAQRAVEAAEQAEDLARIADEKARDAEFGATVAGARFEHTGRILNRWAASLWRGDSEVGEAAEILNTSLENPALAVDIRNWLTIATEDKNRELRIAKDLEVAAETAAAVAVEERRTAEELRVSAEKTRREATDVLAEAERSLKMLLGQTISYQIVIGADGCPVEVPDGVLRGGAADLDVEELCRRSVEQAATPEAALAIKYAFRALGAPYACEGIGRWQPFRYDCSSLVMRAYAEGAGLATVTPELLPNTRDLIPWAGREAMPWAVQVPEEELRPGDLVFYDTYREDSRHVVMLIADGFMLHTGKCNDVAHVIDLWGFEPTEKYTYLISRRIDPELARHKDDYQLNPDAVLVPTTSPGVEDPQGWQGDGVSPEND